MSSIRINRPARRAGGLVLTLLAIELADELVDGAVTAAWPAIRADLALDYAQVGLLLAIPRIVGNLLEPPMALLGDAGDRRRLIIGGGVAFAFAMVLYATSWSFAALLFAFTLSNPASGAFVSLSQATLMDIEPRRQPQNMARWTLAGSLGVVGGAVLIAATTRSGISWRVVLGGIAALAAVLALLAWRQRSAIPAGEARAGVAGRLAALRHGAVDALNALRRRDVLRWLALLQASNLMLDILHGFLALYLVDVAGASAGQAALAIAAWTVVGLLGDALLIPLLERVEGVKYLRVSAALTAAAFSAFLLVPGYTAKLFLLAALGLLNSGWYAITKAGLYSAMPGRSAMVLAVANVGDFAGAFIPLGIGLIASHAGLDAAMWVLLAGPLALLAALPAPPRNAIIAHPPTGIQP